MPDPNEKEAARLAFFCAEMGLIDEPGGAEWHRLGWSELDVIFAWERAGFEPELKKDTTHLWKHETGQ